MASNSLKQIVVENIRFDCNFASSGSNLPPPISGGRGAVQDRPHLQGHPHGLPQQSPFLADYRQSVAPTVPSETLNPHIAHTPIGNITKSNFNWIQGGMHTAQYSSSPAASQPHNLPHSAHPSLPKDASAQHPYLNL